MTATQILVGEPPHGQMGGKELHFISRGVASMLLWLAAGPPKLPDVDSVVRTSEAMWGEFLE